MLFLARCFFGALKMRTEARFGDEHTPRRLHVFRARSRCAPRWRSTRGSASHLRDSTRPKLADHARLLFGLVVQLQRRTHLRRVLFGFRLRLFDGQRGHDGARAPGNVSGGRR